jgi:hypothetical protein
LTLPRSGTTIPKAVPLETGALWVLDHGIIELRRLRELIQRNDLAVLFHSFDRGTAPLIRGSSIERNMFGASDLREFFLELVQSPKLFHSILYRICMDGVGRVVRHLG